VAKTPWTPLLKHVKNKNKRRGKKNEGRGYGKREKRKKEWGSIGIAHQ